MTASPLTTRSRWTRRALAASAGIGIVASMATGVASAKETGSGGATGTPATTTCNPVSSLSYKGDTSTSDTGAASIQVDYGVKPCVKGQAITIDTQVYLSANPSLVYYDNPAAPASGRFTVFGITANTSYIVKVTVSDATTGAVVGTRSIYAAAVYKGV
jgi:hypothetical protein